MRILKTLLLISLFAAPLGAVEIDVAWDPNPASDGVVSYRLFVSTNPLLVASTQQAMADPNVRKSTFTAVVGFGRIATGTTHYMRLTAYDLAGNQSGFNVDQISQPHQLSIFVRHGDVNRDGVTNTQDYGLFRTDRRSGVYNPRSDFNNDGLVNTADYGIFRQGRRSQ